MQLAVKTFLENSERLQPVTSYSIRASLKNARCYMQVNQFC